ncbi:MAG: class I SAM-dependent rRNA methyltransferase [Candidatus Riflebacteria bacterium]|nr:class I SAM-dependent rRNA methyltransferase [Candidatus Riflebacteria bacterium]
MKTHKLTLKKNKEFSIIKGHPWAYTEAFQNIPSDINFGDKVEVYSHKNNLLGIGIADPDSKILVRLLAASPNQSIENALSEIIKKAIKLRTEFFSGPKTTAFRLINGEGDGIPGLIADKYSEAISMQIYTRALEPYVKHIVNEIKKLLPDIKWIYKRDNIRLSKTGNAELIYGKKMPDKIEFFENGLKFSTDLVNGQKTGFFLDQRSNRHLIRTISENKSVLNLCGYTGAFTVAAVAGKAQSTLTVDIARPALEEAQKNLELNGYSSNKHKILCADMYEFLDKCEPLSYDIVILDPPSMAKSRKDSEKAIRAYKKLNLAGAKIVKKGGYLFTASCTSQVSCSEFIDAVRDGIAASGRHAVIIHESYHDFDHPISLSHPEGKYLKGLLLKVY